MHLPILLPQVLLHLQSSRRLLEGCKAEHSLLDILEGSKNALREQETKVQDPYTLRCTPQIHGASRDAFRYVYDVVTTETDGKSVKVRFNSSVVPVSDMLSYTLGKINVNDISVKDADIEEIIRRLYKQGVQDEEKA